MTAYEKARNNSRQFKSLTSLSVEKIDILLPTFESKWASHIEKYNLDGTPRLRKYVPKNEEQLPTIANKLFFLLYYKKVHPLQEALAFQFDLAVPIAKMDLLSNPYFGCKSLIGPKVRWHNVSH